jgi:hypothetical protein
MTSLPDDAAHPASRQPQPSPDPRVALVLDYLENELPGYPFNPAVDGLFVEELVHDFEHLDVLEQVKAFRWFHDNAPCSRVKSPRLALRRWFARTWSR